MINRQPSYYLGWPVITLRSNGELMLVYSGGRDYHVCPFGRIEMMAPRGISDTPARLN